MWYIFKKKNLFNLQLQRTCTWIVYNTVFRENCNWKTCALIAFLWTNLFITKKRSKILYEIKKKFVYVWEWWSVVSVKDIQYIIVFCEHLTRRTRAKVFTTYTEIIKTLCFSKTLKLRYVLIGNTLVTSKGEGTIK